jgi:hypothetical protein
LKLTSAAKGFLKDKIKSGGFSSAFLLCFLNEFVGTFGASYLNFSSSAGNSYFLAAGGAFKMFIGFSFLKIRADTYPFVFKFIPKVHEFLVFNAALGMVF